MAHATSLSLSINANYVIYSIIFTGKSVSLHIATPKTSESKMWIYDDPGGKEWFNTDFKRIYATAYEALYREERKFLSQL